MRVERLCSRRTGPGLEPEVKALTSLDADRATLVAGLHAHCEAQPSEHMGITLVSRDSEKGTPQTGSHQICYNRPLPGIAYVQCLGSLGNPGGLGEAGYVDGLSTSPPHPPGTRASVRRDSESPVLWWRGQRPAAPPKPHNIKYYSNI